MKRLLLATLLLPLLGCPAKKLLCPAGETECDGRCVSLLSDEANCGACGRACGALSACTAGTCGCGPGTAACGRSCVILASSPDHCGACDGAVCGADQVCSGGACAATCGAGLTPCGRSCVDLQNDPFDCGACGVTCAAGQTCRQGACHADLQVACFSTNDVRAVTAELAPAGDPRAAGQGPIALVIEDGRVFAVNSISHSISSFPLDGALAGTEKFLAGDDFEAVTAHGGVLFIANARTGTLIVYDPVGERVLDEIPLGATTDGNPRAIAFVGDRAFVSLNGLDASPAGQAIAVVDFSALAACATSPTRIPCGTVEKTIDLRGAAGAYDPPGLPFPYRAAAVNGVVYVTLANLKPATSGPMEGHYVDPAGPSRLAVIDTNHGDAVSFVSLAPAGTPCRNAGDVRFDGARLWVSCADAAAPGLLAIPLAPSPLSPSLEGTAVATVPVTSPGNLAFCNGMGYVTDLWSGQVLRFDPAAPAAGTATTVCPNSPGPAGWAWAADVACAP
jgi:hypothetical protein